MTMHSGNAPRQSRRAFSAVLSWLAVGIGIAFFAAPAHAQQTGDISGQVFDASGAGIGGVSIEASSNVLPQPRSSTTASNGRYRLRLLPPGEYTLEFTFADGSQQTRGVMVMLQQTAEIDMAHGGAGMEEIVVTGSQMMVDTGQGSLKNSISADTIDALPVGQEYRDLFKLIPGVAYSELGVRGPNSGGSGQDNSYQFDGVDVSLPLFGTLASEPSSHDIAGVSIVRGGAKAIGFNRSGGFLMNTVSKTGTDEFKAEVGYQVQTAGLTGDQDTGDSLEFDEDRSWSTLSIGGPILRDRLYFYTSYYRPERSRDNTSNDYGSVGDFDSERDEYFGKLTFSPTDTILLDLSYRTSDRENENASIGSTEAASLSVGEAATQDTLNLEGSWIINDDTSLTFNYTDFENLNSGRPDNLFSFIPQQGDGLDVANLASQGYIDIPTYRDETDPVDGAANAAFNAAVMPYVDQYSYNPGPTTPDFGGGAVGGASSINNQDFFRESFEIGLDHTIYTGNTTHDFHIGYQTMEVSEDLNRRSNGWGYIDLAGGQTLASDGVTPVHFIANVAQQSLQTAGGGTLIPSIFSSADLQSIELNDTITAGDWTYNIGVMISNDVLYGQGLAANSNNPVTGLEASAGSKYKMYEVDWADMIQPRLGVAWEYSDSASVYLNYARYNPSASSLARAASWDRNLARTIDVAFAADGSFIESDPVRASSGKWFDDGLEPRFTDEFLVGMTQELGDMTIRAHVRHKKSENFWEDTNNNARSAYPPPGGSLPPGIPTDDYIPNLQDIRDEIGGSSYVIAQLDGAFTKFWEASVEADWQKDSFFLHGSYTWSHYYGNFDQDVTTTNNDQSTFIGSSNIADGAGRQLWNFKEGNLGGDRRHKLKLYGYYQFNWEGRAGAYLVYQSGEPWEKWDRNVYSSQTGSSSDTIRYAEPAGSRTTDDHWQLDLNYTHNFIFANSHAVQLRADVFNVFDNQTGYNIDRDFNNSTFGDANSFYKPRRIQLAVKYAFN